LICDGLFFSRRKVTILNFNKLMEIDGNLGKINSVFPVNELKIVLNELNWQRHILPISKCFAGRNDYSAQFPVWPGASARIAFHLGQSWCRLGMLT
jgi:hypothetical protein